MSAEPVGVMKCWECIEKHGRDIEHHLEDLIRVTKDDDERLLYEDWIDYVREIRKTAHERAKGIATEPLQSSNPDEHLIRIIRWAKKLGKKPDEYLDLFDKLQVEYGFRVDQAYEYVLEKMGVKREGSSNPAKPIRVERGKDVWVEVFHEKEECHPATFRVIKPNPEHILTVCCPVAPVAGRCPVAMMAQKLEHLHPEGQGSCPVCQGA